MLSTAKYTYLMIIDYYSDYSLLDGSCSCPTGNPPCSFCTDTYPCEACGHRNYSDDATEHRKHGWICEECGEFYGPKGFWYWFWLSLLCFFCFAIPGLWVLIISTIPTYRWHKQKNYQVPNFIRFFYEYNFTQTYFKKKI